MGEIYSNGVLSREKTKLRRLRKKSVRKNSYKSKKDMEMGKLLEIRPENCYINKVRIFQTAAVGEEELV